jgi:signal transduction protein with GAF and PtsI domain
VTSPLQAVLDEARDAFGAAACSLAVLDEDEGELVYRVASGAGADAIVGVRLPITRGIAGWVAASGQPIAVSDLASDPRHAADVAASTAYAPTTLLVVPVLEEDAVLGVLSVLDRDTARPEAQHDLELAASYAMRARDLLVESAPELPDELTSLAELLHDAEPHRREVLRQALRRLLDESP